MAAAAAQRRTADGAAAAVLAVAAGGGMAEVRVVRAPCDTILGQSGWQLPTAALLRWIDGTLG